MMITFNDLVYIMYKEKYLRFKFTFAFRISMKIGETVQIKSTPQLTVIPGKLYGILMNSSRLRSLSI